MKQGIFFILIILLAGAACKKTPDFLFKAPLQNVYFDNNPEDSVVYTFAYKPDLGRDTVFLPVKLAGLRAGDQRQFGVEFRPRCRRVRDIPGRDHAGSLAVQPGLRARRVGLRRLLAG